MLMATGHLAMGRVWASVNRLIAITIAHAPTICAIAIISGLVVSSIDGIIGRVGHVHSLMDRQKPGFAVFPAADSHFSKATLRQNRAQSLAVATAAVTIAILPFFLSLSLSFFLFCFLFFCLSLCLSLVFPSLCPSITSQFRQTAWKTTTHDLWGALCAVLFPETFGQLRWTICGFVRLLANYGWKISDGWVSVIRCQAMGILNFWVIWRSNLWIFVFLDTII